MRVVLLGGYVRCPERVQGCTSSPVPGAITGDVGGANGAVRWICTRFCAPRGGIGLTVLVMVLVGFDGLVVVWKFEVPLG